MSFLSRLFKKTTPKTSCPRCLGKGYVNSDDIERLGKTLKWLPGPCAYCNGNGRVDATMPLRVDVDLTYLVINLSPLERKKIIVGEADSMLRAKEYEKLTDDFINNIVRLHFSEELHPDDIALILLGEANIIPEDPTYQLKKADLLRYINQVIAYKA